MQWRSWKTLLGDAWGRFRAHEGLRLSAAVTFDLCLVILGTAVVLAWTAGVLGFDAASRPSELVHVFVGEHAGGIFDKLIEGAGFGPASVLGMSFALLVGSMALVSMVTRTQHALNQAFEVERRPRSELGGMRGRLYRKRLLGTLLILCTGLLLTASASAKTTLEVFHVLGMQPVAGSPWLFRIGEFFASLLIATGLFTLLFQVLPDSRVGWSRVWQGAGVAAKLFTAGMVVTAFFLVYFSGQNIYGAAAGLLLILVWFYFSAVSFFYGGEFARAYQALEGDAVDPEPHARHPGPQRAEAEVILTPPPQAGPDTPGPDEPPLRDLGS